MVGIIMANESIDKMSGKEIFFVPLILLIITLIVFTGLASMGKKDVKLDMEVKVSESLSDLRLTLVESEFKSQKLFQYYLDGNIKKELDGEEHSEIIEEVLSEQRLANQKLLLLLSKLSGE
jgi:hypothetical protein